MNDAEAATVKLAELLRHPEDLDKIPALKSEFTRKKAAVDSQLKSGLKEQLEITQSGMSSITNGQRTVNAIKEEMMKIDKLCAEAQNMIRDFPHINLVAQTHRNFEAVEKIKRDIDLFDESLGELEMLLKEDDTDLETQPNLLLIHYKLTKLREFKDDTVDQIKSSNSSDDSATELINNLRLDTGYTLNDYFTRLDDIVDWFDEHIGTACLSLIELVKSGNDGLVVRLAVVIEDEEKRDKKAKEIQEAQREFKDLATRFKSITAGPKELRRYKEKFIQAIEGVAQGKISETEQLFLEDPEKLEKSLKWYFNDLNAVKLGMVNLMPKKWNIFKTYVDLYHKTIHDWLISRIDSPELTSIQMLSIVQFVEKYYAKMQKLGVPDEDIAPHLIDNRAAELVRDYRQLIIKSIEEWMDRMASTDKQAFLGRVENALDEDENGYFRTKTLGDMWRMLREQLIVASGSQRTDVAEGVVDAMFRALTDRQRMWQELVDSELVTYSQPTTETDGMQALLDWLVAIANDQIACIDEGEDPEQGQSYVTRFQQEFSELVSPQYATNGAAAVDSLREGYIDLGTHCISVFAQLIFVVDFKTILPEFFTPVWYSQKRMSQIVSTFQDYLSDYERILHPSLRDIVVEEFSDQLLLNYLQSVRNKGAKFRRQDPFIDKIKDDVLTAFGWFEQFPAFPDIKQKWRVIDGFTRMIETDKSSLPEIYEGFKMDYWDVGMPWVEAVLRARDDFERSMLNGVKAKAAEVYVERGPETIMSKVK